MLINSKGTDIECHPMPETGYQEIWDIAKDHDNIDIKFDNLVNFRKNNPNKIILYAKYIWNCGRLLLHHNQNLNLYYLTFQCKSE